MMLTFSLKQMILRKLTIDNSVKYIAQNEQTHSISKKVKQRR